MNSFQNAGATQEPSASAPLYTSKMFTGWYTNRSPLQDGVTPYIYDKLGYGRQDSILDGQNMEISPRLTLVRRAGTSVWSGGNTYQRINRFYSFNTFTLTAEVIRVMVDDSTSVWDAFDGSLKNLIFTKSPGASSTYFLGVGNTLYFTNGVDNKQVVYDPTTGLWQPVTDWGIVAPTTAPTVSQDARPNPYPAWQPNAVFGSTDIINGVIFQDPNGNLQRVTTYGTTAATEPNPWNPVQFEGTTDGSVEWQNMGPQPWDGNHSYAYGDVCGEAVSGIWQVFTCVKGGTSGPQPPTWMGGLGTLVGDGTEVTWQNSGALSFGWYGPSMKIVGAEPFATFGPGAIVDSNGYLQQIAQSGVTGATPPKWQTEPGAYTTETSEGKFIPAVWLNVGPYSSGTTAPWLYGYAYMNSVTDDISNMSPASAPISVNVGGQVVVQGQGSADPQVDKVLIYRTAQGGSTFLYLDEVPNPGAGQTWTYTDTSPDSALDTEWQAQRVGEGTPLPVGATCLAYHLGRIFAAVGNVVWASAGPDAVVGGSSGNAGFNISFTCQSKVIRLWPTSIGLIVFTIRDAYIIQGNGIDVSAGGTSLFISVWIENLPLLSYDAFTTFGTTAFLFTGKNMVISLDPGAGIVETSQPIADVLEVVNPKTAYLTYHSHNSRETALYLGNGQDTWYRLNLSIAPESGFAWSLPAYPVMGMSALQSVEVTPGVYQLLMGPKVNGGQVFYRDTTTRQDGGASFPAYSDFGVITLAPPGQIAGVGWMNLEAINTQNEPTLLMLMGELSVSTTNPLEPVRRTRHDPPNLPESTTLDSTRYTFLRGGSPIWCRHLIFRADFGTTATADELLSFTIFGSVYQEVSA